MDLNKDFVDESVVDIIIEGRVFKFKPTTAGDENDWLKDYMVKDEEGKKLVQDLSLLNKCKLRNLVHVPYSKEVLVKLNNLDKDWKDLNPEERWQVLSKLKPSLFSAIISKMNEVDSGQNVKKKV